MSVARGSFLPDFQVKHDVASVLPSTLVNPTVILCIVSLTLRLYILCLSLHLTDIRS